MNFPNHQPDQSQLGELQMPVYASTETAADNVSGTTTAPAKPRRARKTPATTPAKPAAKTTAAKKTTARKPAASTAKTPAKPAAPRKRTTAAKTPTQASPVPAAQPAEQPRLRAVPDLKPEVPATPPAAAVPAAQPAPPAVEDDPSVPLLPVPMPTILTSPSPESDYTRLLAALDLLALVDPMVSGTLAEVTPDGLRLSAKDHERTVVIHLDTKVAPDRTGSVVINHRQARSVLLALTSSIPKGQREGVDVMLSLGAVPMLRVAGHAMPLTPGDPADFPEIEHSSAPLLATLKRKELADAATLVGKCRSRDESLIAMCAVNMMVRGGRLQLEATDRYRLARTTVRADCAPGSEGQSVLIFADEIARSATALPGSTVVIGHDPDSGRVTFTSGHARVSTYVVPTQYLKTAHTDSLFTRSTGGTVDMSREDLVKAIKTAQACCNAYGSPFVDLVTDAHEVYVVPVLEEHGDTVQVPPVHAYGDKLPKARIQFNPKFLAEVANLFSGYASISMGTDRDSQQACFAATAKDLSDPNALRVLLMAVREGDDDAKKVVVAVNWDM
jgi:DNA polymerase III sliding clamp (beta) subunit (PCNA family)